VRVAEVDVADGRVRFALVDGGEPPLRPA